MCTMIATRVPVTASARTGDTWSRVGEALVTYDHATHVWSEHALRIDFVCAGGTDRVAVELDLASGRALLARLTDVLAAADRAEAA